MKKNLFTVGCLAYAIIGIIQIAATIVGFEAWWGWNGFFAVIGAIFVGYLPILGTIMGIMGAIKGWDWSPLLAILFFCWPLILNIVAVAVGGATEMIEKFKK